MDKLEKEVAPVDKEQDEDVLSYALFPQVATDFFKYRQAQEKKVDEKVADTEERSVSGIRFTRTRQKLWRVCLIYGNIPVRDYKTVTVRVLNGYIKTYEFHRKENL